MYFKINTTGCGERKGLVEVRYDLFLDSTDIGYEAHYIQAPIVPKEGYTGKVENGIPVDIDDYNHWFAGLERVWQNNPFCCHFVQFEPTVTDEEILYVGELALMMAYQNNLKGNLMLNKNEPIKFSEDAAQIVDCKARTASVVATDFTKVATTVSYKVR